MAKLRDWRSMLEWMTQLLKERTGEDLAAWNQRIAKEHFTNAGSLRAWLAQRGVTSYPQSLLVWEQFGYPDYMTAAAADLINAQYTDRQSLRPIFDAIIEAAVSLGELTIQARKTYVSLMTPRRTFARIQPTTRNRIDLALRIEGLAPGGRLKPSKINPGTPLQVSLASLDDLDAEVLRWLEEAYRQNTSAT